MERTDGHSWHWTDRSLHWTLSIYHYSGYGADGSLLWTWSRRNTTVEIEQTDTAVDMKQFEHFMGVNRLATAVVLGQAGRSNPHISVQQGRNEEILLAFNKSLVSPILYIPDYTEKYTTQSLFNSHNCRPTTYVHLQLPMPTLNFAESLSSLHEQQFACKLEMGVMRCS